jgi:hypothetical protein
LVSIRLKIFQNKGSIGGTDAAAYIDQHTEFEQSSTMAVTDDGELIDQDSAAEEPTGDASLFIPDSDQVSAPVKTTPSMLKNPLRILLRMKLPKSSVSGRKRSQTKSNKP